MNISLDSNPDEYFRYKMPKVLIRSESSGNGIRTAILNINDIARALERCNDELIKSIQLFLNTSKTWVARESKLILKGSFTANDIEDAIMQYIKTFILCDRCSLPETHYKVSSSGKSLKKKCNACGFKSKVDGNEKLIKFIINR